MDVRRQIATAKHLSDLERDERFGVVRYFFQ